MKQPKMGIFFFLWVLPLALVTYSPSAQATGAGLWYNIDLVIDATSDAIDSH